MKFLKRRGGKWEVSRPKWEGLSSSKRDNQLVLGGGCNWNERAENGFDHHFTLGSLLLFPPHWFSFSVPRKSWTMDFVQNFHSHFPLSLFPFIHSSLWLNKKLCAGIKKGLIHMPLLFYAHLLIDTMSLIDNFDDRWPTFLDDTAASWLN